MIDRVLLRSLIPLNPPDGFLKPQTQQLSPLEFIARLTTHIPGHYERLIHYYGVYSSRSLGAGRAKAPGAQREVAREKPPTPGQNANGGVYTHSRLTYLYRSGIIQSRNFKSSYSLKCIYLLPECLFYKALSSAKFAL